jgi:hypothetical protein
MEASALIADVRSLLAGEPVFLAGSLVAEQTYGKVDAHSDVDLFVPTAQVMMTVGQRLLCEGYKLDDRFERVWVRWKRYGFKSWHTNSLRLMSPSGMETNLVYKLTGGHPASSLAQVLESFDFGLLATGYDLESDTYRDMRPFLFPGLDPDGPLPLMPNKRSDWRNGFISRYNGLREVGRYAKYHQRGYDMSLVKDDLCSGYFEASAYLSTHFDPEQQQLGLIYEAIGMHIDGDNNTPLVLASKDFNYNDSLDEIMATLE